MMFVSKDKIIEEIIKTESWGIEEIKLELTKLSQGNETRLGDVLSQRGRPCGEKATPGPGSPKVQTKMPPQIQTGGKAERNKRRTHQTQTGGEANLDGPKSSRPLAVGEQLSLIHI